jgi:hypothetical protein
MHNDTDDANRPGLLTRLVRGVVFLALLPFALLGGLILLPVFLIGRLFGIGPRRGRGRCGHHRHQQSAPPPDPA